MDASLRWHDKAALVAAAGKSARMGQHKALLKLDGETFVARNVAAFAEAGMGRIFVTLPESEAVADQICSAINHEVIFLKNTFMHRELLGSVQTVLSHHTFSSDALLVTPVDAPFASAALIAHLCAALNVDPSSIVFPTYQGQPAHPLVISRPFFAQALALDDNTSLRDLVARNQASVTSIEWPDSRITLNINTPEDYARLTNPSARNFDAAATDAPGVKFW